MLSDQDMEMKKRLRFFTALFIFAVAAVACVSPITTGEAQPASSNDVATVVAMTLQALAPQPVTASTAISGSSTILLPHSLYFLSNDSQSLLQVFRMERDGKTKTQLTFEPAPVWDYDISPADGSLAYEVNGQLVLVNADGSNRRVLAEVVSNPEAHGFYHPVFSPDGKTLAFAYEGLNLYDLASGASNLVIKDQLTDNGSGQMLPVETYSPERYSPDGTKLLVALGHWEVAPSHAVYYPGTNALVRYAEVKDYIYCCSFHGGPSWSPDSASFYGIASSYDFAYKSGELWRVDAVSGMVTRMLINADDGTMSLPEKPYLAPNGQLYYFFGTYRTDSGFFDAPLVQLVRSSPDGVTNRTVLRSENFRMMNQALWAPDASFVIVATAPDRFVTQDGGVLELYPTNGQKSPVWLALFGKQMKWGP
jgi:Tol biopolymer transport system component